jgi:MAF protein
MASTPSPEFILASASPRRSQLLALTGWTFTTAATAVDESPYPGEAPEALATRLARSKAQAAAGAASNGSWVLAADTLVVDRGAVLGKPGDEREALEMLGSLRARTHQVITSLALIDPATGEQYSETCSSQVSMRDYSPAEVQAFVARGEAWDKAGGYAIQDPHFRPVDMARMQDCFANVVGLPLCHLVRAMRRAGLEPRRDVPQACQAHTDYRCPVYREILEGRR